MNLEDKKVEVSGSSGERYLCREFGVGATMLAIGIEDENPAFESERVENGMEYCMNDKIDEVVFGIAWATDYEGADDVRVWFAADPTVYFKTESETDVTMTDLEKVLAEQIFDLKKTKYLLVKLRCILSISIGRKRIIQNGWN